MHEMVKTDNTEEELKKSCVKIGEHLYAKKQLKTDAVTDKELEDLQIVFLMGGKGTRLLHITQNNFSKHMIDVNGQPLSKYTFDLWKGQGFDEFFFLIDSTKMGDSIKEFYQDGSKIGAKINYSVEEKRVGSGGALKLAIDRGFIKRSFIVHHPDDMIVCYENFAKDFAKVFVAAVKAGYQAVLICVPGSLYPFGEVYDEDGEVKDFIEKPFIKKDSNAGIYGISSEAFGLLKKLDLSEDEMKIERTVFKELARAGKMFKVLLPTEYWVAVNDDPNLRKFEEIIKNK